MLESATLVPLTRGAQDFKRGAAVGEFVGLVTAGIDGADVMVGDASGQRYQIFQGQMGTYPTRPISRACCCCYLVLNLALDLVLMFISCLNRQLYKIY